MIRIKGIKKSFDKLVLDNLNLDIEDGTIFGLVGINGAGKSTLLKIMAGIIKPEEGLVYYDDNIKVDEEISEFLKDNGYSITEEEFNAGVIIKNNQYRISIRSRGPEINKVAELHHGGGHKMASGVRVKTLDEALEVMRDLDNELKKYNDEGEE